MFQREIHYWQIILEIRRKYLLYIKKKKYCLFKINETDVHAACYCLTIADINLLKLMHFEHPVENLDAGLRLSTNS